MMTAEAACPACGSALRPGRRAGLCAACMVKSWRHAREESLHGVPAGTPGGEEAPRPEELFALPGHGIMEELARGGMGIVYRAVQEEPRREVAVKMLLPQSATRDLRERFRIEVRVTAGLAHPGILPVFQYGEHAGVPWFSMPLCSGGTLAQKRTSFTGQWRRIATLMADLAEAAAFAHARGVLHRDLKPGNVLFDSEGRAFLSDFGLAKLAEMDSQLTRTFAVLGTPHYMAPELINDAGMATTASEVYALCAILYELLAGHPPFVAESMPALLRKIAEETPSPLSRHATGKIPAALLTVALKGLSREPSRRYLSAQDLSADLRRWLCGEPVLAKRLNPAGRLLHWCRRRPALAVLTLLFLVSLFVASVLIVGKNRELAATLSQSQTNLRTSLLNEARAVSLSARIQERDRGLEAIRHAAAIAPGADLAAEAASLLALPSLTPESDIPAESQGWRLMPDGQFARAVSFRAGEPVRIVELPSLLVLATLAPEFSSAGPQDCFSGDGGLLLLHNHVKNYTSILDWREQRVVKEIPFLTRTSPSLSSDGKYFAIGAPGGKVELYRLDGPLSEPVVFTVPGFAPARPYSFSPDSRHLALTTHGNGQTNVTKIVSIPDGRLEATLTNPEGSYPHAQSWFGDSSGTLSGMDTGGVYAWHHDSAAHGCRHLTIRTAQVFGSSVQPQGQLAAVSAFDNATVLLDWPSGREVGTIQGNSFLTRFSRNGLKLAVHDQARARLTIHRITDSPVCRQFALPSALGGRQPGKGSWCAALRPDGSVLATAQTDGVHLFDALHCRHLAVLPGVIGNTLAWTGDGRVLWSAGPGVLRLWRFSDAVKGTVTVRLEGTRDLNGHTAVRLALAESADRWAASCAAGIWHGRLSQRDAIFSAAPPVEGRNRGINPLALSPDGKSAVVSEENAGGVSIVDLTGGKWNQFSDGTGLTYPLFSPDGKSVWLASLNDFRRVTHGGEPLYTDSRFQTPSSIRFVAASADGRLLATTDGSTVVLRDGDGIPFLKLRHPLAPPAAWMSLTPDGSRVTFSGLGHIVQVWDLRRLAAELEKLGLKWAGPSLPASPPEGPAVTQVIVESGPLP